MSNGSTTKERERHDESALPRKTSIPFDFAELTNDDWFYWTERPEVVLEPWITRMPEDPSEWGAMFCPVHEDPETSEYSSTFNLGRNVWRCWAQSCHVMDSDRDEEISGPLHELFEGMRTGDIERHENLRGPAARKKRSRKGAPMPSIGFVRGWHDCLMNAPGARVERARAYLHGRGLTDDVLAEHLIGWDPDHHRITLPVFVKGEVVNVRRWDPWARNKKYRMLHTAGTEAANALYPHDAFMADDDGPVLLCEGEPDSLLARRYELNAVTGTTGAGALSKAVRTHREAFRGRRVLVALDADEPGEKATERIVRTLESVDADVATIGWPSNVRDGFDLTDLWRLKGDKFFAESLRKLLDVERPIVVTGGAFILDEPEGVPSVWGDDGNRVLWAEGEGFMLVGPQGVGKTTLAQQVSLRKIGLGAELLLDIPIKPAEGKVLYLAMDRPRQAARSFRRMVRKEDREILDERLVIHRGPLSFDPTEDEKGLWELMKEHGCVYVIVDSLKDYASSLTEDGIAIKSNRSFQWVISHGGEVLIIHHQRKANNDNRKPDKLDDVYGSTWHTSGMGSVVLLWGTPGSHDVELRHLKQPAEPVGPLHLTHDHATGTIALSTAREDEEMALLDALQAEPDDGLDLIALTESLGRDASEKKEREATRRRLEALVKKGDLQMLPGQRGGKKGSNQTRWKLL